MLDPCLIRERYAQLFALDERTNPLSGSIAEQLGREIIEGDLEAGSIINSAKLAERFAVSRTPVREALVLLQKEGLVTMRPQRKTIVSNLSVEQVHQIYSVRACLFSFAVELIACHATDAQIRAIDEAQRNQEEALRGGDIDAAFWALVHFENLIINTSGNAVLVETAAPLQIRTLRLLRQLLTSGLTVDTLNHDARRIIKALYDRDARLASELYRVLVLSVFSLIQEVLGPKIES